MDLIRVKKYSGKDKGQSVTCQVVYSGVEVQLYLLTDPSLFTLGIGSRYPLYGLSEPQGLSEREWKKKSLPSPGFEPQTVKPVVSRHAVCAIPAAVCPSLVGD
jgi:hypothetical protein